MEKLKQLKQNVKAVALCQEFISSSLRPKFILGRNRFAASVGQLIGVQGYVDDFTDDQYYLGKRIYKADELSADALVLTTTLGKPLSAKRRLDRLNLDNFDYFTLYKQKLLPIEPVPGWPIFETDYPINSAQYQWVYDNLADQESQDVFESILAFRLSGNLDYMAQFCDRQAEQYFEPFITFDSTREVFVDIGGFDGATTIEFINRCHHYKKIIYFEPSPVNFDKSKISMSLYDKIDYYSCALSDQCGSAVFSDCGSNSGIRLDGNYEVEIKTLDSIGIDRATYIKMDVEGHEKEIIHGARQVLAKDCPKLAICVYHQGDDLWQVPKLVLSIQPNYRLYLRHYTEGIDETVMYFVPN